MLQSIKEQLSFPDEETRRIATAALAEYRLDEIKGLLFAALGDNSWRVRKEALEVLFKKHINSTFIEELAELLRASDNAGQRNSACEALERLGKRAVPILSTFTTDSDQGVRKFAIDILGSIGLTETVPLLIKALTDPDPNVMASAAENLGKIGDERAVSELVKMLDRSNIPISYIVLEALGKIGRPVPLNKVLPLVEEVLLKKPVIDCIGAIGDVEAVPILIDSLVEKARQVRTSAANALIAIRRNIDPEVAENLIDLPLRDLAGKQFTADLIASIGNPSKHLTEPIVIILGLIGDPRSTETLLEGCRDDRMRRACLQAFRKIGAKGIKALIDLFPTADEEHRCYITFVCGDLAAKESADIIRVGMKDMNHVLRRIAASAAGSIGVDGLIPELLSLLEDEEYEVRLSAVESLAHLAPVNGAAIASIADQLILSGQTEKRRSSAMLYAALKDVGHLARLLKDEEAVVRKAAVFALAELKSPESINHLVLALVDEEPDVRMSAAGALGALGGETAVKSLLVALKDRNPWVKCSALRSLATLKIAEAEPMIVEIIEQGEGIELISALKALLEINNSRARLLAKKSLAHHDKEVVKAAVEILSHNNDTWLEEYAQLLLFHEHWDIRQLFVKAVGRHHRKDLLPILQAALENESDDLLKQQIMDVMDTLV